MSKRLGKNLEDADSRRLWEAAERAAANRRKLVVLVSELKNLVSESGAITKKSYDLFAEESIGQKAEKALIKPSPTITDHHRRSMNSRGTGLSRNGSGETVRAPCTSARSTGGLG